jgi:hypothetical protein
MNTKSPEAKPSAEERVHHPYSPSSLQTREACPKFQQRGGPVHEMAITGTQQHDAVDSETDDPTLADYRAFAVTECIELCQERTKAHPGGTVLREEYLPVDDEVIEKCGVTFVGTTAGYLDYGVVSADGKHAEVLDWKFGNNLVEDASNNLQGIAYALGILKRFPNLEDIEVTFVMPHADFRTSHRFFRSDFDAMMLRVVTVVRRAQEAQKNPDDFTSACPNNSACRFCGLVGRCPKVIEKVIQVARKYAPLRVPDQVTPTLVSDPKDVKIGIALADIVIVWAEAFKRQATAKAIEDPNFIPEGYKLATRSKRNVVDARKLGELAKEFIPDAADHKKVEALYDIPIGKLEKLISTAAPRGLKESTVKDFGLAALSIEAVKEGEPYSFLQQSQAKE